MSQFFSSNFGKLLPDFVKYDSGYILPALFILFIHYGVSVFGFHSFTLTTYPQLVQNQFPAGTPFWEMLFYFHGNPPLLSLIHKLAESLCGRNIYLFFDLVLPWLHVGSFCFFRKAVINFGLQVKPVFVLILFLNPLIFIYFKYPFYSTFLFFLNSWALYLLACLNATPKLIFGLTAIFSAACLLRSSYLPILIFPFAAWLSPKKNIKTILVIFLIFLPPLFWQFKNFLLVGKFTSSTWTGMNFARCHKPWYVHNQLVDFIAPFSLPDAYFQLLKKDVRIQKEGMEKNTYLNQNNLNNRVIPIVSDLYFESILVDFSPTWSFNTFLNGLIYIGKSPANFNHLLDVNEGKWMNQVPSFCLDFFDFTGKRHDPYLALFVVNGNWDLNSSRSKLFSQVTIYTILYPILLVFFALNFFRISKIEKGIFLISIFFFLIYSTIDVFESNRMRMEIEVYFYFMALTFACRSMSYFKKIYKR